MSSKLGKYLAPLLFVRELVWSTIICSEAWVAHKENCTGILLVVVSCLQSASKFKCPCRTITGSLPVSFTLAAGCSLTLAKCSTSEWWPVRTLKLGSVAVGALHPQSGRK